MDHTCSQLLLILDLHPLVPDDFFLRLDPLLYLVSLVLVRPCCDLVLVKLLIDLALTSLLATKDGLLSHGKEFVDILSAELSLLLLELLEGMASKDGSVALSLPVGSF